MSRPREQCYIQRTNTETHKVKTLDLSLRLEQADLVESTVYFCDMLLHRYGRTISIMCIRFEKELEVSQIEQTRSELSSARNTTCLKL